MVEEERWLSKKQAARLCGFCEKTIDRAVKKGVLRRARNGVRAVRIAQSDLLRWMNGGQARGA
jgi:excisionase family DNA binding protein